MAPDTPRGKHAKPNSLPIESQISDTENLPHREWNMPANKRARQNSSMFNQYEYPNTTDIQRYDRTNYGKQRNRRNVGKIAAGIVAVLLIYTGFLGVTAKLAYDDAKSLRTTTKTFVNQLMKSDASAFSSASNEITAKASSINDLIGNPLWIPVSFLPGIGADVTAARTYAAALDDLSSQLLDPMVQKLESTNPGPIIRENGSFNADTLQVLFETFGNSSTIVNKYAQDSEQLADPTINRIADIHKTAKEALNGMNALAAASLYLASSIHYFLGSDGTARNYIILAQNNSERHAAGGLIGSFGPLIIDNGSLSVGDFNPWGAIGRYNYEYEGENGNGPEITEEEMNLFGLMYGFSSCDLTSSPDFPRDANYFAWCYQDKGFGSYDGVIALDPIVLQQLLAANNIIVSMEDGSTITGSNAATYLLHDIYYLKDGAGQDAYFAEFAKLAFSSVFDNLAGIDFMATGKTIWKNHGMRHLQAWFPDDNLQAACTRLGFSGEITHDETAPVLGVYVNDQTWSKISWYLTTDTTIKKEIHNSDNSYSYEIETILQNNITEADMAKMPRYVYGTNKRKRSPDDMLVSVYLFAPTGGSITDMHAEGTFVEPTLLNYTHYYPNIQVQGMQEGIYEGLQVWYGYTCMQMGESITLRYIVNTSTKATEPLQLDQTPAL